MNYRPLMYMNSSFGCPLVVNSFIKFVCLD